MTTRHVTFVLLLAAALLVGCGKKQVIETPDGSATMTTDGDTTTVTAETPEGTSTTTATTTGDDAHVVQEGPDGTTEITKEGDTTTMTSDAGDGSSMTHKEGGSDLSAEDVGVEFYPGSEPKMSNVYTSGPVTTNMVQLTSTDDPDKIQAFYKDQLGSVMSETKTDKMRTLIKMDGKIQHSISIQTEDGVSTITISRVENAGG